MTNLVKLLNLCKLAKQREACHVGESDDFGEDGEISSNSQTYANLLNIEMPTDAGKSGEPGDFGECDEYGEISSNCHTCKLAKLGKACHVGESGGSGECDEYEEVWSNRQAS